MAQVHVQFERLIDVVLFELDVRPLGAVERQCEVPFLLRNRVELQFLFLLEVLLQHHFRNESLINTEVEVAQLVSKVSDQR